MLSYLKNLECVSKLKSVDKNRLFIKILSTFFNSSYDWVEVLLKVSSIIALICNVLNLAEKCCLKTVIVLYNNSEVYYLPLKNYDSLTYVHTNYKKDVTL